MVSTFTLDEVVLNKLKDKYTHVSGNDWILKKELGDGFAKYYDIGDGQLLIYGDSYQFKPMILTTELPRSEEYGSLFSIMYKEVEEISDDDKNFKYEIATDGIEILSGDLNRRRIWLPNKKYKFLSFVFTEKWFLNLVESLGATDGLWDYLGNKDKLELYVPLTASIKQIINQLFFRKEELMDNAIDPFIQLKSFELIMLTLSQYFKILNGKRTKKLTHL